MIALLVFHNLNLKFVVIYSEQTTNPKKQFKGKKISTEEISIWFMQENINTI